MTVNYPLNLPKREFPKSIFLAGTIEMGNSVNWQVRAIEALSTKYDIFNPRRDNWDTSWEQNIDNTEFFGQVSWELENIENADIVLFYFAPGTKSPISLLELGICSQLNKKVLVICPEGFWRKGNVDIVASRYKIESFIELENALEYLITE